MKIDLGNFWPVEFDVLDMTQAITQFWQIFDIVRSCSKPTIIIIIIIIAMTMFMVMSSWPKVIARVHPVYLINADWAPGGRQPSDQASRLGLWVRRKLAAIIHIHHRHCYYYSARRLIIILPSHEGWRLSRPKHCSKGAQPVLKTISQQLSR